MSYKTRDFNYMGDEDALNDYNMRELFIDLKKQLNEKYIHGSVYDIDCLKYNENYGAEGERGTWDFDRWCSGQSDLFGLGFNTLNIQNSKWHYWGLGEWSDKNKDKYIVTHPGYLNNEYFRINRQYNQICVVDSETIRNTKIIKILFDRKVSNGKKPEDWICIPQEYVKTYNKQKDGTWLLNGTYDHVNINPRSETNIKRAVDAYRKFQMSK